MKKFHHPAVLPLYAAFVTGKQLWFVTPFMVSAVQMRQHAIASTAHAKALKQLDKHAVPCCAVVWCVVQGLGSVRSLLKQHFPLVGRLWTRRHSAGLSWQYQRSAHFPAASKSHWCAGLLLLLSCRVWTRL
jgi:hypothetical protein